MIYLGWTIVEWVGKTQCILRNCRIVPPRQYKIYTQKPCAHVGFLVSRLIDRAFKSFRLKKRSSTLGVNKTSESPPILRRQQLVHPVENGNNGTPSGYATMRHTINVGHQNPAAGNGNFIRGGYRSSLQNMNSSGTVIRIKLAIFIQILIIIRYY